MIEILRGCLFFFEHRFCHASITALVAGDRVLIHGECDGQSIDGRGGAGGFTRATPPSGINAKDPARTTPLSLMMADAGQIEIGRAGGRIAPRGKGIS